MAAAEEFSERGYESTQLQHIATRARLRTPSIYYHFTGKKEIARALGAFTLEQSAVFATDIAKREGRAGDKLCQMLEDHFYRLTSGPYNLWFLVRTPGPGVGRPSENERYAAWRATLKGLVKQAIQEDDFRAISPEFALYMIVGCVHGALEMRHLKKKVTSSEMVEYVIRALASDKQTADAILKRAMLPR